MKKFLKITGIVCITFLILYTIFSFLFGIVPV